MTEAGKLEETKGCHHRNVRMVQFKMILLMGRCKGTNSVNLHYMTLFKNSRDEGQMRSLTQQVFPSKVKFFMDSFQKGFQKTGHSSLSPLNLIGCVHELSPFDYHSVRYVLVRVMIFLTTIVTSLNTQMDFSRILIQNYLHLLQLLTKSIQLTLTFTNLLSFQRQNFLREVWFD